MKMQTRYAGRANGYSGSSVFYNATTIIRMNKVAPWGQGQITHWL